MKNLLLLISSLILLSLFISCNKKSNDKTYVKGPSLPSQKDLKEANELLLSHDFKIDIDLTKMSSTMVYAEVFNMMIDPEYYENKFLRIKGNFNVFENSSNKETYFAVIITDATACCQQGIEFIWVGNHKYPEDYPQIGQEITITGQYKIATTKDDIQYCYLAVTDLR